MRWHEAPLVPLASAFAIGIATSAWITAPAWWLLGAGALLLGLTVLALALRSAPLATAGLVALAMLLGAARASSLVTRPRGGGGASSACAVGAGA